ncbi:NAD(P)H-hydrate epimerase [Agromyces sp. ZXT2-3]|uniref:NAD(P)H-hydrate epimerase n=1 Tax=Agromyces sp. ZXT2-3 TaxID=3461152 RepID=UPI004054F5CC
MDVDARATGPSPRHGYTAEQVRAAERPLLEAGEPLMQRAALALADEISRLVATTPPASKTATDAAGAALGGTIAATDRADAAGAAARDRPLVVVLAGSGDNGGDALFAGAHLAERGADVGIVATGSRLHEEGGAAAHRAGATDLDPDADPAGFEAAVRTADVIVDGILGIGAAASPALRGRSRELVARVLELLGPEWAERTGAGPRHPLVVAVDLPSGISPDDGRVPDPTVLPADVTVTMGAVKAGLLFGPAVELVGRVVLVDLGLGPALAGVQPVVLPGWRHDLPEPGNPMRYG